MKQDLWGLRCRTVEAKVMAQKGHHRQDPGAGFWEVLTWAHTLFNLSPTSSTKFMQKVERSIIKFYMLRTRMRNLRGQNRKWTLKWKSNGKGNSKHKIQKLWLHWEVGECLNTHYKCQEPPEHGAANKANNWDTARGIYMVDMDSSIKQKGENGQIHNHNERLNISVSETNQETTN